MQKYKCKACRHGGVFGTKRKSDGERQLAVKAVMERSSLRGVGRIFGVAHATVGKCVKIGKWVKKAESAPEVKQTLLPYHEGDVLEPDGWNRMNCGRWCMGRPTRDGFGWRFVAGPGK